MKRLLATTLFCGMSLAGTPVNEGTIVQALATSSREVWLYAPKLNHRAQAEALRRAMIERGVVVTILVLPAILERVCDPGAACRLQPSDRDNYVYSLALAGARLFEATVPGAPKGFYLVDRRLAFEGAAVGTMPSLNDPPTQQAEPARALSLHQWFLTTLNNPKAVRRISPQTILERLSQR